MPHVVALYRYPVKGFTPEAQTLVSVFRQREPTFAVALHTRGSGGEIRLGDEMTCDRAAGGPPEMLARFLQAEIVKAAGIRAQ